jgi:dephospho-CoA kinase
VVTGFAAILRRYERVAIAGGPGTGKTTLAREVSDRPVIHTDDFRDLPWADIPREVIRAVAELGPRWCVEGCLVARALRRGLRPDVVIVLDKPRVRLNPKQAEFTRGVITILREVRRGSDVPFIAPEVTRGQTESSRGGGSHG